MADSVRELLQFGWHIYRTQGIRQVVRDGLFYGYETALRTGCSLFGREQGDNIFEEDWDVLLILDACRADLLRDVQDEYPFIDAVDTRWSVGSTSAEWMGKTFTPQHQNAIADTTYVTGNPFSNSDVTHEEFKAVHEVWRTGWDDAIGTVRPRSLTDTAIQYWRKEETGQMIVHYMQPHYPFIGSNLSENGLSLENWGSDVTTKNVWTRLRDNELESESLWKAYRENLRVVLDDVELLLASIDAERVVLTADHGNGVGEYGVYGHPRGICLSALREVPWVETTAANTGEYEPRDHDTKDQGGADADVSERLEALGYK